MRRMEGAARSEARQWRCVEDFIPSRGAGARYGKGPWQRGSVSGAVLNRQLVLAGFHDIAVVRQAVEHGGRHFGVAEHLRPVGRRRDGRYQQRRVLLEFADQMEQQLTAGLAEREIAEFVDDDEIIAQQVLR